jgi:hypothetical protein
MHLYGTAGCLGLLLACSLALRLVHGAIFIGGRGRRGCRGCRALLLRLLLLPEKRLRLLLLLLSGLDLLQALQSILVVLGLRSRLGVLADGDGLAAVRRGGRVHEMTELVVGDDVT